MNRTAFLFTFISGFVVAQETSPQIAVGANIHVSQARSALAHYETWIAAHPSDPQRLLGASMLLNPDTDQYESIAYASSDGGRSWSESLRSTEGYMAGDPVPVLGPGGSAYFICLPLHRPGSREMLVYRSEDSARTWSGPAHLPFLDREAAAVDATGRLYLHGTEVGGKDKASALLLFTSTDGGRTFAGPARLAAAAAGTPMIAGNSVITRDGAMFMVYADFSKEHTRTESLGTIRVAGTVDLGKSWTAPVAVGPFQIGSPFSVPGIGVDTSSGPFAGRMYTTWVSLREQRSSILVSYSEDRGQRWSEPVVVNDDSKTAQPAPEHTMPVIAVNSRGVVGVLWYDRREFKGVAGFRARFAASVDGGKTFLSSVPISETYSLTDRPMVVSVRDRTANGAISLDLLPGHFVRRAGDTAGMTADANGVFHPLWVDNRGGIPQAWTARVTVGDATEVTSRVSASLHEILLTGGRHVTAKLRVRNTSDNVIAAPYFVRVTAPDINPDILTWEIEEPLKAGEMSPDHELAFDLASALDPAVMTPTFKLAGLQVKVYLHK